MTYSSADSTCSSTSSAPGPACRPSRRGNSADLRLAGQCGEVDRLVRGGDDQVRHRVALALAGDGPGHVEHFPISRECRGVGGRRASEPPFAALPQPRPRRLGLRRSLRIARRSRSPAQANPPAPAASAPSVTTASAARFRLFMRVPWKCPSSPRAPPARPHRRAAGQPRSASPPGSSHRPTKPAARTEWSAERSRWRGSRSGL